MTDEQQSKQTVQDSQHVAQSDRGGISIVGDGNIVQITPSLDAAQLQSLRADYLDSLRRRFEYLDLGGIAPRGSPLHPAVYLPQPIHCLA
jgi:hypothetical protein